MRIAANVTCSWASQQSDRALQRGKPFSALE
jgi:hypothetical protein